MEVIGVIPARYESTRLSRKLVRDIEGKPLIQWTWQRASQARSLDKLIIACDNPELEAVVKSFGADVVMTSDQHKSGTDRIGEAVRDIDSKVIINIQADEPLIHPSVIDALAATMLTEKNTVMATVKTLLSEEEEISNPNVVKVVTDKNGNALYFSRYPLPYRRNKLKDVQYYKHIGIYAYTKDFLYTFKNLPSSFLEDSEKLEQLRALESGYKIRVIETNFDSWGVDTEEDLVKVERFIARKGWS